MSENILVHSIVPHDDKTMKMQNPKCPAELIIITACLRAFSNNVKVNTTIIVTHIQKKNSTRSTPKYTYNLYSGGFLFRRISTSGIWEIFFLLRGWSCFDKIVSSCT